MLHYSYSHFIDTAYYFMIMFSFFYNFLFLLELGIFFLFRSFFLEQIPLT